MVETKQILTNLEKSFGEVKTLNGSLLKCIQSHKQKPIAYYYFDTSELFFTPGFDLTGYQEQFIANDYYRTSGWIQWNFYLVFIYSQKTEGFSASKAASLREIIEKNKEYTRKYVIPVDQFDDWIDTSAIARTRISVPRLTANVAARWIEKLDNAGLSAINSKTGRDAVVRKYIEASTPPMVYMAPTINELRNSSNAMGRMDSLELLEYRQNIIKGTFPLGAVTLLTGANGTGKTSFLEAIELCICGRTLRNGNRPDETANVVARFADGTSLKPHSDNALYRARDAEWYNTSYPKDNRLCHNFARYNYFDTDAAYRLAYDQDNADIEQAFSRLALGEEVDFLEKRIRNILVLFQREETRTREDIQELQGRLKEMNLEQSRLKSPSSAEAVSIKHIIETLVVDLHWRHLASEVNEPQLEDTLMLITNCIATLKEASMMEISVKRFSISALQDEVNRVEEILPVLNTIIKNLTDYQVRRNTLEHEIRAKTEEANWLRVILRYLQDSRIAELPGLSARISTIEETILNNSEAVAIARDADYSWMREIGVPLPDYSDSKWKEAQEIRAAIQDYKSKADEASQKLSHVAALKARIAGDAEELLQIQPDLAICPICGTIHAPGAIQEKLHAQAMHSSKEEFEFKQANARIAQLEINANKAEREMADVQTLSSILLKCDVFSTANGISCKDGIAAFESIKGKNKVLEKQLGQLRTLQSYMSDKGFTEDEYVQLMAKLPLEIRSLSSHGERLSGISTVLCNSENDRGHLRNQCKELDATIEKAGNDISILSRQLVNRELSPQELYNALQKKTGIARTAITKIANVRQHITIEDNTDIFALLAVARRVQETISTYLNHKHQASVVAENIKLLIARIDSDNKLMLKHKKVLSRCEAAVKCLYEILSVDSSEKAMAEFTAIYRAAILQAFLRIQSPREFDDIDFGASARNRNGTSFALKRKSDGRWASLSEVSTGQRSALALAIFLALNLSAETAPPLLLLDDPIAHADDLNLLSFFDYLRALVVQGSRQVVFATADEKMAYLFKSKFSFLEQDLVIHET
jgi:DNA repair exonuclease SbcCD ATPase subunit